MKKVFAFLLCLALLFSVSCADKSVDSIDDSSAAESRNNVSSEPSELSDSSNVNKYRPDYGYGTCKQLRGDVLVVMFFLDDFESKWTRDDISRFTTNEVMPALRFLERSAEKHGVELSFTTDTNYGINYNGEVIRSAHESDYVTADTLRQAVKALYYNSDTEFIAQMKQVHGVDEVVCFTIFNKDGTAWDMTYKHPGGETDLAINVFVEYIEGDFELVSTAQQLKNARTKNIYLLNDIDLQGEAFSFSSYSKIFKGNNYTIKNFKVNVVGNKTSGVDDHLDSSLKAVYGSLFGNLNNATISDVTFENVEFVIDVGYDLISKVYISPLCVNMTNSTISNVSINASYSCSRLHSNFEMDNLVVTQENYIIKKEESSINNVKINISKGDN